jgi:uncharacterized membrane protein YkvA (DUF1232 family)
MTAPGVFARLRGALGQIKREAHALWLAARDPRVPWPVKLLALGVAAYALSPIDLIPDAIPVLGYVDDAIVVSLGVLLVARLIPPDILAEHRRAADAAARPVSRLGAALVIVAWLAAGLLLGWFAWSYGLASS